MDTYKRKYRERRKERKVCQSCSNKAVGGKLYCKSHAMRMQRESKELRAKRIGEGLCIRCGQSKSMEHMKHCVDCIEKRRTDNKKRNLILRAEVFAKYGGKCACCGEDDANFLQLDHVNGGGAKHRRENGIGGGKTIYVWAKKNNYPNMLQVLCANCNYSKLMNDGMCSHTKRMRLVQCPR